jgi:hypothetical protein
MIPFALKLIGIRAADVMFTPPKPEQGLIPPAVMAGVHLEKYISNAIKHILPS